MAQHSTVVLQRVSHTRLFRGCCLHYLVNNGDAAAIFVPCLLQGAAKRKGKKNERKKMSRKRKVQQFKGLNGRDDKRGNKSRTTQQHSGKGEHSSAHF